MTQLSLLNKSRAVRLTLYQRTQCSTLSCIEEITNYILWLEPEYKKEWIKRNRKHISRCENWQSYLRTQGYGWCEHYEKAFSKYFSKEIAENLYDRKDGNWSPLNVSGWKGEIMLPVELIGTVQQKVLR